MDIFTIIKDGLPDLPEGATISDKAIKAIEKAIKDQQGLEFIPKAQYTKKTERIDELEAELVELQGRAADGDGYKEKYETEAAAHAETKNTMKAELDSYKATVESEAAERKTGDALRKKLLGDNVNPKYADIIIEKTLKSAKLDKDGNIDGYDELVKPHKEAYPEWFTIENRQIFQPGTPPPEDPGGGKITPKSLSEALHQKYEKE